MSSTLASTNSRHANVAGVNLFGYPSSSRMYAPLGRGLRARRQAVPPAWHPRRSGNLLSSGSSWSVASSHSRLPEALTSGSAWSDASCSGAPDLARPLATAVGRRNRLG